MKNKSLLLPLAFLFGGHTLYAALRAIYTYLGTDIVLRYSLWFDAIDVLVRNAEVIVSAMMLTFLIYSVYRYGVAASKGVMLLSLGALMFKYVAVIAAIFISVGVVDLTGDVLLLAFALLLEIALAALAVLLAHKLAPRAKEETDELCEDRYRLGALFSLKSRLNASLFFSILALALGHAISFLFYYVGGSPLFLSDVLFLFVYLFLFSVLPALLSLIVARALVRLCVRVNA